jgi:hypothetical protein
MQKICRGSISVSRLTEDAGHSNSKKGGSQKYSTLFTNVLNTVWPSVRGRPPGGVDTIVRFGPPIVGKERARMNCVTII